MQEAHIQNLINLLDQLKQERQAELEWFKQSGKIIAGYFCNYTPPELIEACGAVPVRILDTMNHAHETAGRKYIQRDACSFCKAALGYLLQSANLSCVVSATTCDQMRRLHEHISAKTGFPVYLVNSPRTYGKKSTFDLFKNELQWLIRKLTGVTGDKFSEEKLRSNIEKWNHLRAFLANIHTKRQQDAPPINGKTMLKLVETAFFLGPEKFFKHTGKIEQLLNSAGRNAKIPSVRLLFAGSIVTPADQLILDLIEEQNKAVITSDILCSGTRWFNFPVAESGNVFENVVQTYHNDMICPHRRPNDPLFKYTENQLKLWNIDGIICRTLKFCHPWSFEVQAFRNLFKVPLLHLDTDYSNSNVGQLRTRIQAFIEILQSKR